MKFRKRAHFTLTFQSTFDFEISDEELEGLDEDERELFITDVMYGTAYNLSPFEIIKGKFLDLVLGDEMLIEDVPIPPLEQLAGAAE